MYTSRDPSEIKLTRKQRSGAEPDPSPPAASSSSSASAEEWKKKLVTSKEFLDLGVLTQVEFNRIKKEALQAMGLSSVLGDEKEQAEAEEAQRKAIQMLRPAKEDRFVDAAGVEAALISGGRFDNCAVPEAALELSPIAVQEAPLQSAAPQPRQEAGSRTEVTVEGVSFTLVHAPEATFEMGSPPSEKRRQDQEGLHTVTLRKPFQISTTAVTQELYEAVIRSNPSSRSSGSDCPVENVSWFHAVRFCNALSSLLKLNPAYRVSGSAVTLNQNAYGYRLPTEAEWEYAARAGERSVYAGSDDVGEVAWYNGNSGGGSQPVGQKKANAWGIHDMCGNVWEWVWDWYGGYPESRRSEARTTTDPLGSPSGNGRILRGGSFNSSSAWARTACRDSYYPEGVDRYIGFRVVAPV